MQWSMNIDLFLRVLFLQCSNNLIYKHVDKGEIILICIIWLQQSCKSVCFLLKEEVGKKRQTVTK